MKFLISKHRRKIFFKAKILNMKVTKNTISLIKLLFDKDTIFKKFQEKFLQNKRFVRGLELICDTKEYGLSS